MRLITGPNLRDFDSVYQRLLELHAGCDEAESLRINSRLILTLINHIGDEDVVYEAFDLAKSAVESREEKQAFNEKGSGQ